jgi:pimeloyl-ACP methyl ester carboxylesterase
MPYAHTVYGDLFYAISPRQAPTTTPPLVLLHGVGGTHLLWPAALRRLPSTSVYALDLPGHGRSGGSAQPLIEHYVEAVDDFLQMAGLQQAVVAGHSMGGAVALKLGLDHAQQVAGLVLIATGARLRVAPPTFEALQGDINQAAKRFSQTAWGAEADQQMVTEGRLALAESGRDVLLADFRATDRFDVTDQLIQIRQPTLIIVGTRDQLTPPRYSEDMNKRITDSRLVKIEGAGHMVMLERPDETAGAIRQLLDRLSTSRTSGLGEDSASLSRGWRFLA